MRRIAGTILKRLLALRTTSAPRASGGTRSSSTRNAAHRAPVFGWAALKTKCDAQLRDSSDVSW